MRRFTCLPEYSVDIRSTLVSVTWRFVHHTGRRLPSDLYMYDVRSLISSEAREYIQLSSEDVSFAAPCSDNSGSHSQYMYDVV